ncbi:MULTISPECIES: ATP-dependent DNA helicase [Paenibacillus]|uniref:Helicase c2 n=2 Tax=Paenibacillus lactis TaxID=228574 RepID=G4HCJ3_9BACL|nr:MULTISPECIES: ATP-dependent DNA helicase [Paenibacillus]EHB65769.1 helicase c2 [Paenibacillus lactis 154]MBP1891152.1 Rad3-related DNA helicase [Paenibacillus lactis]MCM3493605.1 ATP-dependent DNA helicase [Paenibacillus lactis]GIO93039.1 ATP-dependent helicase [Paenibacillus lactis]HAF98474.1 ATP-dependent DNA helicase [Paenibacillus lactis]
MPHTIQISVRPLVEYVFRSGSIVSGFRSAASLTEGTRAHQQVQREYGENDQKEVQLEAEIAYEELLFVVEGRCDGLIRKDDRIMIDEIKSTSGDLSQIEEDSYPVHWAQAKMYAYMYAKQHGIETMEVRLTYFQVPSGERKQFERSFSIDELVTFVEEVIAAYAPYARLLRDHAERRDRSIKSLAFPFPAYREGQRKLAGSVYKTIEEGRRLFAKAPTGIGKTISTLFPSVKAIGEGLLSRIFYLTAKTITRTAAEEAMALMERQGLHTHAVTLTAKDKICFSEAEGCGQEGCIFSEGYYDRINAALLDLLGNETLITRSVIETYARKHQVCPFEFSLDASYAADVVICDYNYVFDPRVSFKRMPEEVKKRSVLLIDEAHNLVDRARGMFSAELYKSAFLDIQRAYKESNPGLYHAAKRVNNRFIVIRKVSGEEERFVGSQQPEMMDELLEDFVLQAEAELMTGKSGEEADALLECYFAAQGYLRISKLYDDRFVTYAEISQSEVYLKLFCLDPSDLLQKAGKNYRSAVFFSATLMPLGYYRDMLGAEEEDYSLSIPSPFSREQLDVRILPLSTRYKDREQSKDAIVRMLSELVREKPVNTLIFLPSYPYMQDIHKAFTESNPGWRTLLQGHGMSEEERENFLGAFQADAAEPLIGFAVMGGIFSEGIDLKGERLSSVVVVGVGLPQLSFENDIIKDYFDRTGKRGYDYAYVYPGMNKVLQAGGRLIRSEHDTGTLTLVDDRFLNRQYSMLLPEEWRHYKRI